MDIRVRVVERMEYALNGVEVVDLDLVVVSGAPGTPEDVKVNKPHFGLCPGGTMRLPGLTVKAAAGLERGAIFTVKMPDGK